MPRAASSRPRTRAARTAGTTASEPRRARPWKPSRSRTSSRPGAEESRPSGAGPGRAARPSCPGMIGTPASNFPPAHASALSMRERRPIRETTTSVFLSPLAAALVLAVTVAALAAMAGLSGCQSGDHDGAKFAEAATASPSGAGAGTAAATDAKDDPMANYTKPPESELRQKLSSLQFKVTQEEGTEPPFRNEFWDNHEDGIYVDVVSGEPLFSSKDKFDSGTGWPSFTRPLEPANV